METGWCCLEASICAPPDHPTGWCIVESRISWRITMNAAHDAGIWWLGCARGPSLSYGAACSLRGTGYFRSFSIIMLCKHTQQFITSHIGSLD
jgi:hypothetical protein